MKKFLSLMLACLTLMAVMTGCTSGGGTESEAEPTPTPLSEPADR